MVDFFSLLSNMSTNQETIDSPQVSGEQKQCSNCGHFDQGEFCSHCGLPLEKKRITLAELIESILDFFSDFERKYVLTVKQLMFRPIEFINEYIAGKRDAYYIPFKYFFLNLGLNFFVYHGFNLNKDSEALDDEDILIDGIVSFKSEQMFDMIIDDYGQFISLLSIPIYILITLILFPKSKHNVAERVTAICFIFGQLMLYQLFFHIISAVFPWFQDVARPIVLLLEIIIVFLMSHKFFNQKLFDAIWKSVVIFMTLMFCMQFLLILFQQVLEMIYD